MCVSRAGNYSSTGNVAAKDILTSGSDDTNGDAADADCVERNDAAEYLAGTRVGSDVAVCVHSNAWMVGQSMAGSARIDSERAELIAGVRTYIRWW